jgi:acetyltransferase-like isoleucine patch superfamily enzyme
MKERVRRYVSRFLLNLISVEELTNMISKISADKAVARAVCSTGVRFGKTANVVNLPSTKDRIRIEGNTIIDGELLVFPYGGQIRIGDNSYVGSGSRLWSGERIDVGNNVLISHLVHISDTSAHEPEAEIRAVRFRELYHHGLPKTKETITTAAITIEDNVWINNHVIILKGVTIGEGSIIAAGTVVTKSVPPFSFVAGNPSRIIKSLSDRAKDNS